MKAFHRYMMCAGAASLAAGMACAGSAWATSADQSGGQSGSVTRAQSGGRSGQSSSSATSRRGGDKESSLQVQRDDHSYAIKMKEGKVVSATIDGEPLPADRIVVSESAVKLLDEQGKVVFESGLVNGGFRYGMGAEEPGAVIELETRPMIGVTLSDVGEALAGQLGIDPSESVVISGVTSGMPAEKAGLKKFDVVVKIDGKVGASSDALSKAVRSRKPGDAITLGVLREGKPVDVQITVGEGSPAAVFEIGPMGGDELRWMGEDAGTRALAERLANQAREQSVRAREIGERYRAMAQEFGDRFRVQMHAGAERAHELLGELHEAWDGVRESVAEEGAAKISDLLERLQEELDRSGEQFMGVMPRVEFFNEERDGRPRALVVPTPPAAPSAPSAASAPRAPREFRWEEEGGSRSAQLESRIKSLEERIEALMKKLDEKGSGGGR